MIDHRRILQDLREAVRRNDLKTIKELWNGEEYLDESISDCPRICNRGGFYSEEPIQDLHLIVGELSSLVDHNSFILEDLYLIVKPWMLQGYSRYLPKPLSKREITNYAKKEIRKLLMEFCTPIAPSITVHTITSSFNKNNSTIDISIYLDNFLDGTHESQTILSQVCSKILKKLKTSVNGSFRDPLETTDSNLLGRPGNGWIFCKNILLGSLKVHSWNRQFTFATL